MKTPSKPPFYTLSSHFLTSLRILTCSPQKTCGVFSLNIQTKFWMAVRFVSTGCSKHLAYIKFFVYRCKYRNTNLDKFNSFLTLLLKVTCRRKVSVLCPPDRTYIPKAKQYIYVPLLFDETILSPLIIKRLPGVMVHDLSEGTYGRVCLVVYNDIL